MLAACRQPAACRRRRRRAAYTSVLHTPRVHVGTASHPLRAALHPPQVPLCHLALSPTCCHRFAGTMEGPRGWCCAKTQTAAAWAASTSTAGKPTGSWGGELAAEDGMLSHHSRAQHA